MEGLYYPTPVTPEEAFQAIGRLRKEAMAEIERLIEWPDSTENHMCVDNEDGGDHEPSLGFINAFPGKGEGLTNPGDDREGDNCDDEPSLGFLERHPSLYGDGRDQSGGELSLSAGR